MQPYGGTEFIAAPEVVVERTRPFARLQNHDLFNIIAIILGWGLLLLLVPPQHEYPIIDDWIYAGSVRNLLETGTFTLPTHSQTSLIGLTYWGAAWSKLFGFSFTTLTYSTLVMALAALLAFYGITRAVNVPPWGALLGTALLAFNPIFLHLSYSFMTDVPFLTLVLVSCYCYTKGIQGVGIRWVLAGSLFTSWALLIRQFGVLVPVPFLFYLALEGLLQKKWRWWQMVGIVLLPAIVGGAWYVWLRSPPTGFAAAAAERSAAIIFHESWLRLFLLRAFTVLPLLALFTWSAVKMRRVSWRLTLPLAVVLIWGMYAVDLPTETLVQISEPPFTAHLGPFSFDHPQEMWTFGAWGNTIRVTGLDFFEYKQEPIWTQEVWRALWALGALLAVILLAKIVDGLLDWLKELKQGTPLSPRLPLYLLGIMIFVISMAFPADLFDRYILGFLPFVIIFMVRGSMQWGRAAWTYSIAALVLISLFATLAKADQINHDNARWQAGRWMQTRIGAVHVGFDWDQWTGGSSDTYQVADLPLDGFRTEQFFPYTCRLCGFTTRYVLAQSRADMPPLPQPSGGP